MPIMSSKSQSVSWDIGSYSIKVVVSSGEGENLKIDKAIEVQNPTGVAVPEQRLQLDQLQGLIGSIISEYKIPIRNVRYSLPESVVSTQVIDMPNLSDAELSSAITWQAEQYLPIPKEELVTEYQILSRPDAKSAGADNALRVLLVGTRSQVIEQTIDLFRPNGVELELMETQSVSLARQLSLPTEAQNTMFLNIGANMTTIIALRRGLPFFVLNYPESGELLTKALINNFSIPRDQAEEYKKTYGLLADQADGKVAAAIRPVVDIILTNVRNALGFFSTRAEQEQVARIFLSGGTSQLPGLVAYFQSALGLETALVDNFNGLKGNLPAQSQASYSVVLGTAKRKL